MKLPVNWLALGALISTASLIGTSLAFTYPLFALALEGAGTSADLIGVNAAMSALAIFAIAPWLPRIMAALELIPAIALGMAIYVVALLLCPLAVDVWLWSALRFVMGLGMALAWVATETAVNAIAEDRIRGRVMGIYATVFCVGYALGPVLISITGSAGWLPFLVAAGIALVSLAPLLLVSGVQQAMGHAGNASLLTVLAIAPVALGASLVFGLAETTSFTLLPLYGLAQGYQASGAALLLSVLIAGNVVLQIPIGWLGDRRGRVRVLITCAALGALTVVTWPLTMPEPWLAWPTLLLGGGLLGGMYTLSLATLGERFKGSDLAVANTAFVTLYQVGAMVGPPLGGLAMGRIGPDGLPLVVALALIGFVVLAIRRRRRTGIPAEGGA